MLTIAQEKKLREPDVRYEPSPQHVVELMLKLANVHKGDIVYDLGCGDGRIVITAVKLFGATGVGIDIDPARIEESRQNAVKAGVMDRVNFRNEDLFVADIQEATVVTLFLSRSANLKLRPKLLRELKPGVRVVSYYWDMGDWKPDKQIESDGDPIYIWTIPANKAIKKWFESTRSWYGARCLKSDLRLCNREKSKQQGHKTIEHYEKFLDLWKDANPGIAEVEDARKRVAVLEVP